MDTTNHSSSNNTAAAAAAAPPVPAAAALAVADVSAMLAEERQLLQSLYVQLMANFQHALQIAMASNNPVFTVCNYTALQRLVIMSCFAVLTTLLLHCEHTTVHTAVRVY
jgi:hypothetical protein